MTDKKPKSPERGEKIPGKEGGTAPEQAPQEPSAFDRIAGDYSKKFTSRITEAIDGFFSLASSKSPINLNPLQLAYDAVAAGYGKVESIGSQGWGLVKKTRDFITKLFK